MDVDVEHVGFRALGGADAIVVNDLAGTHAKSVDIDLNALGGGGDAQPDTVVARGTDGEDHVRFGNSGGYVGVDGLAVQTRVLGGEADFDDVSVATLGGADRITMNVGITGPAPISADGGDDVDTARLHRHGRRRRGRGRLQRRGGEHARSRRRLGSTRAPSRASSSSGRTAPTRSPRSATSPRSPPSRSKAATATTSSAAATEPTCSSEATATTRSTATRAQTGRCSAAATTASSGTPATATTPSTARQAPTASTSSAAASAKASRSRQTVSGCGSPATSPTS